MFAFLKNAKRLNMKRLGKEGKYVFATLLKKKVTTAFIISFLVSTLLVTYFTLKVAASPTPTVSISPSHGYVGKSVQVSGTIDTNGTYRIFFDKDLMVNGTASLLKAVNTTFLIPHCFKGNHVVTLHDVSANTNASTYFTVDTKYYMNAIMPPQQTQLMEGQSTTIRVNVTGGEESNLPRANVTVRLPYPLNNTVYYSSLQLVNTTHPGEYIANSTYPRDFGIGAHTNYTGIYKIASNITSETAFFTVGLTNATQYHRFGTVAIQGSGYAQQESVWINITSAGKIVFSTNVTAIGGIVNANWTIPLNAKYGTYNVTITNSTSPGTIKPIPDTQTFTITTATFPCQIYIKNLDNKNVSSVTVEAYNGTRKVSDAISNKEGLATFSLEAYTYSFKAFFKGKQVGNTSALDVGGNVTYTLACQLANIKLSIGDKSENPLPFITIDLKYNYTKADGNKLSDTRTLETNTTGIVNFQNTFTNTSYLIEAKRYGYVFNRTFIGNLTASQWIDITCPTYTLFVHVVDSKELPLRSVFVNVTEWSSELLVGNKTWVTDDWASVSLNLTFGRYKVKVYDYSADLVSLVVLNETTVDLTEDRLFKTIHCRMANLSPSVLVIDYLGQPIPNAIIEIERFSEIEQKWVKTPSQTTDSNGVASLPSIGGDYSISIYVSGQLGGINSFYIGETRTLLFKIDKYVTIGGLILETSQLVAYIALGLLIISLGIALTYKKLLQKITKK
jgi:hypothetical protein